MSEWWRGLWNDPVNGNVWALGAVLAVGAAIFGPVLFMMGRDMFRRRKQVRTVADIRDVSATEDEQDPQADVRAAAMAAEQDWAGPQVVDEIAEEATKVVRIPQVPVGRSLDEIDAEQDGRWLAAVPAIEVPEPNPQAITSGRPHPVVSPYRIDCVHCKGVGYVPGINDLLGESAKLIGEYGDEVIRMFYAKLFLGAPDLRSLFPGDPTEGEFGRDHKGAQQRDKLLSAVVALSDLYDPAVPAKMERLDTALRSFGRHHATFVRRDGTIKGATWEEYAAVKEALFTTMARTLADRWKPEYTAAWSQAYDYAAAVMMTEQYRSGFAAPRFPRA